MGFKAYDVPTAIDLESVMTQMLDAIASLKAAIAESEILAARVFVLPVPQAEDDLKPTPVIHPTQLSGEEALSEILSSYDRFYAADGESTRAAFRLPGVLCLKARNPGQVEDQVVRINQLKTDFLLLVRQLPDRNTRFEVVHRLFPMAVTLQITRQIQCYTDPVKSVTFTWGRKTALRVTSRAEVIDNLEEMRLQCPMGIDPETWDEMIDKDVNTILSLPADTQLRYRRQLKERPLCNMLMHGGTKRLREANLPILLMCEKDPPRIGKLPDFNAAVPPVRGRKADGGHRITEDQRLIKHLPIYRLKEI